MRHITVLAAAAALAVSAGAALAQSAHQNRLAGPENPANVRATTGTTATGAQSAHQNPLSGPENPANIRASAPSKKLPDSKR
jgi:hypothetical protein